MIKRLYYDLETSPCICFSWRTGSKVFLNHDSIIQERAIICVCYKWEDKSKVHSITWNNGDDKELVKEFNSIAQEADEIVAHNGDKFDLKWLNGRNLIHGLDPVPRHKSVDTLKIARSNFYLNSNRLDYLGKILLGEGKIKTDFDLWKDIVLSNNESAMKKMVTYCKKDVRLLQRIYEKLCVYDNPHTHVGVLDGKPRWTCPYCGSEEVSLSKTKPTAKGMIQRQMQCKEDGRYYTIANKVYLDYLDAKEVKSG
jgi:hypothetical protein